MRTWVKVTIGIGAVIAAALVVLGGTAASLVLRHMDRRVGGEADAVRAIEAVKGRYGSRPPLIEIGDPRRGEIKINRPGEPSASRVDTIHVISWKSDTHELTRADVPLWLMRFSTLNIASQLGVVPADFRLTVGDVERYGPGVLIDYGPPGSGRVLVWAE